MRAGPHRTAFAIGVVAAIACAIAVVPACSKDAPDLLVRPFDAGSDAADGAGADGASGDGAAQPDADPTLGGPCVDDAQCDDAVACTFDRCDQTLHRCRNVPDDTQCDDGVYCNGREICAGSRGCVPGPVVTCEDGTACTIDRCDEAQKACLHAPRDVDGDGDPDDRCVANHDCNDLDPQVASTRREICGNGVDDNCDGHVDEASCTTAAHDTCADALAITAAGSYALDTTGARKDYALSCGGGNFDVVANVTIPAGAPKDLDLWATTASSAAVALGVQGTCGAGATELACGVSGSTTATRARARDLAPGTYSVVVATSFETDLALAVALLDPEPKPTNETCASPQPLTIGTPTVVELVDPAKDLPSACSATEATGELTYSFTLASAADVRVYGSTVRGSGSPVLGLRGPGCTTVGDEIACHTGTSLPLFARALPAGTYVVTVAGTAPIDVSLVVQTSAPTTAPADETCTAPPAAALDATMTFDLGNHQQAIKDGCYAGGPAAAYDLPLGAASDVLLVARFPNTDPGGVSLDDATCSPTTQLACANGTLPVRTSKRNVPPGDYRVVVADTYGQVGSLTTLVRPTVPPTTLSPTLGDDCTNAATVPADGGFFTGDTSQAHADFAVSCDQGGTTGNGAPDYVLRVDLALKKRVVLDMEGSVYSTILDVRTGPTCPGTEVASACYVGFYGPRSFLDLTLDPGTYWIVLDGYGGASGAFDLDVRVVDPPP